MKHSTKRTKRSGKGKAFKVITRWCYEICKMNKKGRVEKHYMFATTTPVAKRDANERNMYTRKVKVATA